MLKVRITIIFLFILFLSFFAPMSLMAFETQQPLAIDDTILQEARIAGSYPVTFTFAGKDGKTYTETVYITITYLRTIVNEVTNEAIDAHDIEVEKGLLVKLSDADLIRLTKARAWVTNNNSNIVITKVERQLKNADNGTHIVTFFTEQGSQVAVNIIETEEVLAVDNRKYYSFSTFDNWYLSPFKIMGFLIMGFIVLIYTYLNSSKKVDEVNKLLYVVENNEQK